MELYLGLKLVKASLMTREAYNQYRGWALPEDEKHLAKEQGYLVEYLDGGTANHPDHRGYISWSPMNVFSVAYKRSGFLNFSHALELTKQGYRVCRPHWGNKFLFMMDNVERVRGRSGLEPKNYLAISGTNTTNRRWDINQEDVMASDWEIVQ